MLRRGTIYRVLSRYEIKQGAINLAPIKTTLGWFFIA
jgi:hypothetical protein